MKCEGIHSCRIKDLEEGEGGIPLEWMCKSFARCLSKSSVMVLRTTTNILLVEIRWKREYSKTLKTDYHPYEKITEEVE